MGKHRTFQYVALATVSMVAAALVFRVAEEAQLLADVNKPKDDSKQTLKQISKALSIAKRDNKRVLLQFGARSCTWCQLLDNSFENNPMIAEELKRDYLVVMVDVSGGNNQKICENYHTPDSLPFTVILDPEGKQLLRQNIAFADEDALRHGVARLAPEKVLGVLKKLVPTKSASPNGTFKAPLAASQDGTR
ncbi:MAG TPA: thioredoxin family protein [Verrucomicrobiae bacterium]|nr:thioredoxin family protein [Verrucomicrobiae bacterium]